MSELISGKEAWIALCDGFNIQIRLKDVKNEWLTIKHDSLTLSNIKNDIYEYRLKPRTITLNGVKVEQIHSSEWNHNNPQKVILEFKNEDAARFFQSKALEIFNDIK